MHVESPHHTRHHYQSHGHEEAFEKDPSRRVFDFMCDLKLQAVREQEQPVAHKRKRACDTRHKVACDTQSCERNTHLNARADQHMTVTTVRML